MKYSILKFKRNEKHSMRDLEKLRGFLADKYKEKIWKDDIQVLKFICKIAAIEIGNEWIFSEPNYIKYISKDEIGYKIRENKTRFDEFTDLERKQLNSFELGE